jgi:hypothetical protein
MSIPGFPKCADKLSRWILTAHSHLVISAWPVPTYLLKMSNQYQHPVDILGAGVYLD